MSKGLIYFMSFGLVLSIAGNASADLVGHWKLDEGSGNTVYDSGTSGNDGAFEGDPKWAAGYYGGGLEFDGTDNIDCGNDDSFNITDEITLSAWINTAQRPAVDSWYTIPWKENAYSMYLYGVDNTLTTLCADFWLDTGRADIWDGPDTDVPPNEWTHIAVTFNGTDFEFYVNGEHDHTQNQPGTIEVSAINFLFTQAGSNFAGLIDDVRLYDRALTQAEILAAMEGGEEYPYALSPAPEDGALHPDTWANLSWRAGDFAVSHDVYFGDNFDDVAAGLGNTFMGNQSETSIVVGIPGFPYDPDGLTPGVTYYWRIDEVNDADPNSPWKGNVWSFLVPPRTAYFPDPPDGAGFVDLDATLSWTGGFGAKLHTVYLGNTYDDVNNATAGAPIASASYDPGTLEREKILYWRVDEFDGAETHKGDVWSFTTPGAVGNPQPADGAADIQMIETLSWTAADNATSHELYFGDDADAVRNATNASPEYIGPRALGGESYDPGGLAWDSSYAWRVDEVYPDGTVKGLVWTFAMADFLLVDNFESYNDIDPPDPNSNTIYSSWVDGYGIPTNGAITSEELPPYAEQTTVHSGAQSMKYRYDTNLMICESNLTLVYPKDWTAEDVTKLVLWFRGNSGNAAERMFVALDGTAVVYHDDPTASQMTGWNEWVIDLAEFAGIDLTNVGSITIGFGTKNSPAAGGAGTVYFDDIRLYR